MFDLAPWLDEKPFLKHLAGLSFRNGAASVTAVADYSDCKILLGWWQSNSYKLYIKNDAIYVHLSSFLHMARTHLVPFEHLYLWDYTTLSYISSPLSLGGQNWHLRTISGLRNFFPAMLEHLSHFVTLTSYPACSSSE